jgi:putative nucleotidyltransferase with HDIG domain
MWSRLLNHLYSTSQQMTTTTHQQRQLLRMIDRMPPFPQSVTRLLEMTASVNCAPRDLVKVIEHDPVLTGQVLKVVNSAYFGLSRQIASVRHAVVFVGINTVKHLALTAAAIGSLPRTTDAGIDMQAYLRHALTTATISRMLAQRYGSGTTDDVQLVFLAGLLHDIGTVACAQFMPKEYLQAVQEGLNDPILLVRAERRIFGVDHAKISAMLLKKWAMPDSVIEAVDNHLEPIVGGENRSFAMDALYVAVKLSHMVIARQQIEERQQRQELMKEERPALGGQLRLVEEYEAGESIPEARIDEVPPNIVARFGMGMESLYCSLYGLEDELQANQMFLDL